MTPSAAAWIAFGGFLWLLRKCWKGDTQDRLRKELEEAQEELRRAQKGKRNPGGRGTRQRPREAVRVRDYSDERYYDE